MKISALAQLLGYAPDGQYFSKVFHKATGMTPIEYRSRLAL
ncbi:MAG: AraC family transcriptional regulator [Lachnospiraceae bacterium]|nr:AraC family transcriptional regulator [Lachnospiraceae bacterium]